MSVAKVATGEYVVNLRQSPSRDSGGTSDNYYSVQMNAQRGDAANVSIIANLKATTSNANNSMGNNWFRMCLYRVDNSQIDCPVVNVAVFR
jgi:hypothetical protein